MCFICNFFTLNILIKKSIVLFLRQLDIPQYFSNFKFLFNIHIDIECNFGTNVEFYMIRLYIISSLIILVNFPITNFYDKKSQTRLIRLVPPGPKSPILSTKSVQNDTKYQQTAQILSSVCPMK